MGHRVRNLVKVGQQMVGQVFGVGGRMDGRPHISFMIFIL